ncbi:hypothetical protein A2635_04350 [Candidatus Peribacteria bacterium RIFCSPHIGHO2_01_FULL_51_9]|nr:MAG: hypothetical protein A2635_04350 [Candidatus Peribacteria bacterium RIFCSPHIGHO2_01_FULL_51_9]
MVHVSQAASGHTDWTAEDPDPLVDKEEGEIRDEVTRFVNRETRSDIARLFGDKPLHRIPEVTMRKNVSTAEALAEYGNLRQIFEGFGVTEANVQTALYIAGKDPERASKAIKTTQYAVVAQQLKNLRELTDLVRLLDRFAKVEASKIEEIKQLVASVYRQMSLAGFGEKPDSLKRLMQDGAFVDGQASPVANPANLASEWKADLNLKNVGDYDKESKAVEESIQQLGGMSAPETVKAVYREYFRSPEGGAFSTGKAEDAARQLYAENEVGALEAEVSDKAIDMSLSYGPPKRDGNLLLPTQEYLKEWCMGSSLSYIGHIAESLGVRGGARPAWDRITYDRPKLFIAYHALQESIKRGHLPDTREVRRELKKVALLLLRAYMRDEVWVRQTHKFSEGNHETPNETEILRQSHERLMRYNFIRSALFRGVDDLPDDYAKGYYREGIEHSISYARVQTGKWRRRTGTAAYAPVKYLVVKPVGAVIGGGIGLMKFGGGVAKKSIAAPFRWAKKGLSRLNHYLFHEESTLFGSSGGGHH